MLLYRIAFPTLLTFAWHKADISFFTYVPHPIFVAKYILKRFYSGSSSILSLYLLLLVVWIKRISPGYFLNIFWIFFLHVYVQFLAPRSILDFFFFTSNFLNSYAHVRFLLLCKVMDCIVNFPVIIVDDILQEKRTGRDEECCSYSSSNRESWGRCSSLGGNSDGSSSAECTASTTSKHQVLFSFPWPVFFDLSHSNLSSVNCDKKFYLKTFHILCFESDV